MSEATWTILTVTFKVAGLALVVASVPAILLAFLLSRTRFWGKSVVEAAVFVPLVLPPTAVGYALLRLLAFDGPLAAMGLSLDLLLTWQGAVLASAVMALPLMVRTARVAFDGVDPRLEMIARTLGHGRVMTFLCYSLPLAARGLLAALILGFARALGEFGATVIVAGNIPGKTRTLALAIFSAQEIGDEQQAWTLLCIAVLLGFGAVWCVERLVRR